jgi:integral membrane protein (TIGR01906 family)
VEELLLGPGTFDFAGPDGQPFYDPSEQAHLRDARLLLGICLLAGGLAILVLALALVRRPDHRSATWRVISRTGLTTAVAVVLLGFLSIFAFDSLFNLFHRVFFPGGNWSFDPSTQHLVQLYPFRFWELAAAALGSLLLVLGLAAWLLGWVLAARTPAGPALDATSG